MWHMTYDILHVTRDMWHMERSEYSLKISGPLLIRFGIEGVLKIWRKRLSQLMSHLISDKGVCRTTPATQGLLNI